MQRRQDGRIRERMAHTKSIIHEILEEVFSDPTMRKGPDEQSDTSQCGGNARITLRKAIVDNNKALEQDPG